MITTVTRRYTFESAHWLPRVPPTHKCSRVHGHNYTIDVTLAGEPDDRGFVMDFWDLDRVLDPLIAVVDHRVLNEVAGLENPTAEIISRWFLEQVDFALSALDKPHPRVVRVRCHEVLDRCWAEVQPDLRLYKVGPTRTRRGL